MAIRHSPLIRFSIRRVAPIVERNLAAATNEPQHEIVLPRADRLRHALAKFDVRAI